MLGLQPLTARHARGDGPLARRPRPKVPRAFLEHLGICGLVSPLAMRRFLRASRRPPRQCVRINRIKASRTILQEFRTRGWDCRPLPWCSDAFISQAQDVGSSLPHLAGEIYSQEATSMLPALALAETLQEVEAPLVLDLCAAPGSKARCRGTA
ncbi:unnamed protein product [Effrenium voratum]|nr:unnamed protein product [Effrenium voratum]